MAKQRYLYLQLDTTNDCNLRCSHCYHNKEGQRSHIQSENILSLDEIKSLIDDLHETSLRWSMGSRIALSGGEPLMRSDLLDIIDYTKRKNVRTSLLSNGTLLTSKLARELKEKNIESYQISVDGTKEIHNKIRGRDYAYDKAIEGINLLSKEGISVTVAVTAMQSNKDSFEDILKNVLEAGARKVGFKSYVPDSLLGANDPEFLSAKEFYSLMIKSDTLREKYKGKINVLQSDVLWKICQEDNPLIEEAKKQNKYLSGCSVGYRALAVLSDGTVYPCRRLPIKVGHISEGIKKIILENEVMNELRDLNKMKENTLCDKVVNCRGCRAVAYAVTGDYMAKDPMCFKDYIK